MGYGPVTQVPEIEVDSVRQAGDWPDRAETICLAAIERAWSAPGGFDQGRPAEVSLVLADDATVRDLNRDWRGKDKPTNVLSFPAEDDFPMPDAPRLLGDIVLARETVAREALEQSKSFDHHLSHLVVHGLLHLLGYDHIEDREAEEMEALEIDLLAAMGIPDPYGDDHTPPDEE